MRIIRAALYGHSVAKVITDRDGETALGQAASKRVEGSASFLKTNKSLPIILVFAQQQRSPQKQ